MLTALKGCPQQAPQGAPAGGPKSEEMGAAQKINDFLEIALFGKWRPVGPLGPIGPQGSCYIAGSCYVAALGPLGALRVAVGGGLAVAPILTPLVYHPHTPNHYPALRGTTLSNADVMRTLSKNFTDSVDEV